MDALSGLNSPLSAELEEMAEGVIRRIDPELYNSFHSMSQAQNGLFSSYARVKVTPETAEKGLSQIEENAVALAQVYAALKALQGESSDDEGWTTDTTLDDPERNNNEKSEKDQLPHQFDSHTANLIRNSVTAFLRTVFLLEQPVVRADPTLVRLEARYHSLAQTMVNIGVTVQLWSLFLTRGADSGGINQEKFANETLTQIAEVGPDYIEYSQRVCALLQDGIDRKMRDHLRPEPRSGGPPGTSGGHKQQSRPGSSAGRKPETQGESSGSRRNFGFGFASFLNF